MKILKTYRQLNEQVNNESVDLDKNAGENFLKIFRTPKLNITDYNYITEYLENGGDINFQRWDGYTALMVSAVYTNTISIFEYLFKNGAKPNIEDNQGNTALLKWANHFSHTPYNENAWAVLEILTDYGASWDIQNKEGEYIFDIILNGSVNTYDKLVNRYPDKYQEYLIHKELEKFNI